MWSFVRKWNRTVVSNDRAKEAACDRVRGRHGMEEMESGTKLKARDRTATDRFEDDMYTTISKRGENYKITTNVDARTVDKGEEDNLS